MRLLSDLIWMMKIDIVINQLVLIVRLGITSEAWQNYNQDLPGRHDYISFSPRL
jgi:hypothetical protein